MKKIFISYHNADQSLFEELLQQLSPLEKSGLIAIENSQNVDLGADIKTAVAAQFEQAHIILILLSADLLSSDLSISYEIPLAMDLHKNGKAKVVSLLGRACLWEDTPLANAHILPENQVPITSKKHWDSPDEPYLQIAKKVKKWVEMDYTPAEIEKIKAALQDALYTAADATQFELFYRHRDAQFFLPEHQCRLAWLYQNGLGCVADIEKAFHYYELSAKQGYSLAEGSLGWLYEHGLGVQVDYEKALHYYEKAAKKGAAISQNNLGRMYYSGKFVPQNYELAKYWYEKAAAQGYNYAQANLAYLYLHGIGVEKNEQEAIRLYKLAAEQGNTVAIKYLAEH